MKHKGRNSLLALLLLAALTVSVLVIVLKHNGENNIEYDFYLSRFAPLSVAYQDCKQNGLKVEGVCMKCEELYKAAIEQSKSLNLLTDNQIIEYVGRKSNSCINTLQVIRK